MPSKLNKVNTDKEHLKDTQTKTGEQYITLNNSYRQYWRLSNDTFNIKNGKLHIAEKEVKAPNDFAILVKNSNNLTIYDPIRDLDALKKSINPNVDQKFYLLKKTADNNLEYDFIKHHNCVPTNTTGTIVDSKERVFVSCDLSSGPKKVEKVIQIQQDSKSSKVFYINAFQKDSTKYLDKKLSTEVSISDKINGEDYYINKDGKLIDGEGNIIKKLLYGHNSNKGWIYEGKNKCVIFGDETSKRLFYDREEKQISKSILYDQIIRVYVDRDGNFYNKITDVKSLGKFVDHAVFGNLLVNNENDICDHNGEKITFEGKNYKYDEANDRITACDTIIKCDGKNITLYIKKHYGPDHDLKLLHLFPNEAGDHVGNTGKENIPEVKIFGQNYYEAKLTYKDSNKFESPSGMLCHWTGMALTPNNKPSPHYGYISQGNATYISIDKRGKSNEIQTVKIKLCYRCHNTQKLKLQTHDLIVDKIDGKLKDFEGNTIDSHGKVTDNKEAIIYANAEGNIIKIGSRKGKTMLVDFVSKDGKDFNSEHSFIEAYNNNVYTLEEGELKPANAFGKECLNQPKEQITIDRKGNINKIGNIEGTVELCNVISEDGKNLVSKLFIKADTKKAYTFQGKPANSFGKECLNQPKEQITIDRKGNINKIGNIEGTVELCNVISEDGKNLVSKLFIKADTKKAYTFQGKPANSFGKECLDQPKEQITIDRKGNINKIGNIEGTVELCNVISEDGKNLVSKRLFIKADTKKAYTFQGKPANSFGKECLDQPKEQITIDRKGNINKIGNIEGTVELCNVISEDGFGFNTKLLFLNPVYNKKFGAKKLVYTLQGKKANICGKELVLDQQLQISVPYYKEDKDSPYNICQVGKQDIFFVTKSPEHYVSQSESSKIWICNNNHQCKNDYRPSVYGVDRMDEEGGIGG